MSHILTCPGCRKVLRTSAPVFGDKVTCPACAAVFAPSAGGAAVDGAAPGIIAHRPAKRPDWLVDDLEDFNLEPRQVVVAAAPAPRRRSGLVLALGGGLALLVVLGTTALVWPGFLLSGRPASQARTLLAYVPTGSTVVAGAQIGLFRTDPQFAGNWNDLQQQIAQLRDFPAEARELLNDADEIVVAGAFDHGGSAVFVGSTTVPYDADKVKRLAKAGPAIQVEGQTIYPTNNLIAGKASFLALPTDKVLVLGVMPPVEFAKLLGGADKSRLHPDLREQVDHAHDALVWVAARFDDNVKKKMIEAQAQFGPGLFFAPDVPTMLGAVQRGKGALMSIDLGNQKLKLSMGVTCQDAADAGKMKAALDNFWNTQAKGLLAMGEAFGVFVPGLGKLIAEVEQTFTVEQRASTVIASVEANQDTLQQLLGALKKNGLVPGVGGLPK
jgi:hypothetical protein